jgi:hypothetical protein
MSGISVIIQDSFYSDPFNVRAQALLSSFDVKGNYPGHRTTAFLNNDMFKAIQHMVQRPITFWPTDSYNGAFQYTLESDKTWIHSDYTTNWAGVLYLTPEAPPDTGTSFYRHKPTGCYECSNDVILQESCNKDAQKYDNWDVTDQVANVFNRLVIFNANRYHASTRSFGTRKETGRLFQTFFFSTL